MRRKDYGTAPHKEIIAGIELATTIGHMIRAVPSIAVRNMILELLRHIQP